MNYYKYIRVLRVFVFLSALFAVIFTFLWLADFQTWYITIRSPFFWLWVFSLLVNVVSHSLKLMCIRREDIHRREQQSIKRYNDYQRRRNDIQGLN